MKHAHVHGVVGGPHVRMAFLTNCFYSPLACCCACHAYATGTSSAPPAAAARCPTYCTRRELGWSTWWRAQQKGGGEEVRRSDVRGGPL